MSAHDAVCSQLLADTNQVLIWVSGCLKCVASELWCDSFWPFAPFPHCIYVYAHYMYSITSHLQTLHVPQWDPPLHQVVIYLCLRNHLWSFVYQPIQELTFSPLSNIPCMSHVSSWFLDLKTHIYIVVSDIPNRVMFLQVLTFAATIKPSHDIILSKIT